MNLADVFARLWAGLAADLPQFERVLAEQERTRPSTLRVASSLDYLLERPEELPRVYPKLYDPEATLAFDEMLEFAQAIDRRYGRDLTADDVPAARARRMLARLGRLNEDETLGLVIPKRPRWGRWSEAEFELPSGRLKAWDTFSYLTVAPNRIEAGDPDGASVAREVKLTYKLLDPVSLRHVDKDWAPVVGIAPLAERHEDIAFAIRMEEERAWYDAQAGDLAARAATVVATLCDAGANVIVFPEMAVHPNALEAVRQAIIDCASRSDLRLVIAGTRNANGADRPFNEAVIFNHRGEELGRQRKLHRWNLVPELRERYGFNPEGLDAGSTLFEYITPGSEVLILEAIPFGRLGVLVCEDLAREQPGKWVRDHLLLDWLFTPILDSSINPGRWMAKAALEAAFGGRCRVVVANSIPLTHKENIELQRRDKPARRSCGVALCIDIAAGQPRVHCVEKEVDHSPVTSVIPWEPEQWIAL